MDATPELRERLYEDTQFWGKHCAQIVNKQSQLVPLEANRVQRRFDAALEQQRLEGKPMRAIVLKARKTGYSTWVQAKIMHRITQRPYRRALVVAQDNDTGRELFEIGERVWAHLPVDGELALKPQRASYNRGRYMKFGQPARMQREMGDVGLDSSIEVDTANEVEAGRGYTFTELHCSEVAFWLHVEKLTALLNAVPDEPETLIVLESTANGANHFKIRWQQAESGDSGYVPIFGAWHDEPGYQTPFDSSEDREAFIETIGEGEWGEDEPRLVEEFGLTPEQLNWRRQAIVDKTGSKIDVFKQEYPASPEEAFMAAGKHVFSMVLVSRVLDRTRQTDPDFVSPDNPGPLVGELSPTGWSPHKTPSGMVDVPLGPKWQERPRPRRVSEGLWRVWEEPDPGQEGDEDTPRRAKGRYVVAIDPAEGEETTSGERAYHAIQVINHRTLHQAAEYRSRIDPDLIAVQAYLAALYWNRALFVVEKTGGYGLSILRRVWRGYRYPMIYRQKVLDKAKNQQFEDRIGWNTSISTKPLIEDGLTELIRESQGAFESWLLADELTTYVRDPETGKTGPEPDAHSDLLMAFGMGVQVAQEWPIPSDRDESRVSTAGHHPRDPITGY